jgi:DNA-binding FadR family transcriptional regulator
VATIHVSNRGSVASLGYRARMAGDDAPTVAAESTNAFVTDRFPRRPPKRSELIAQDIVRSIREAGLKPGDALPAEAVMLDQYGVGRASLREALRILEVQGLIGIRQGRGGGPIVAVARPADFGRMATLHLQASGARVSELVDARVILEPVLARLAAEGQNAERLADLRRIIQQPLDGEEDAYLRSAHGFHVAIANVSGNRVLDLMTVALHDIFVERVHGALYPTQARLRVHREHLAIANAIFAGDGRRAERLMHRHMVEFAQYVRSRHPALLEEVIDWA